jgi:hypothetical protein
VQIINGRKLGRLRSRSKTRQGDSDLREREGALFSDLASEKERVGGWGVGVKKRPMK